MSTDIQPNFLRPRWSKVFFDLWDDKTRTGLVVSSIAVGVFVLGMIISAYVIMEEDISHSYAAINPPNLEVWTDPFDEDLVKTIQKVPGVEDVEGRRLITVRARRGAEDWNDLTLVGISNFESHIAHRTPLEGAQVAEKDEVVITQDLMHITGFHAGDRLEIELPDGSKHFVKVAGLVADQTTSKPDPSANNFAFLTMKTLDSLGQADYFNQLIITATGDGRDSEWITGMAARVEGKLKDSKREVYRLNRHLSDEHPMAHLLLAIVGVLGALGGLITILSSSLIINTLNSLLTQQLRQIGVMKLIGGRSTQIMGMYLALIIAYGLVALVLAVPLGTAAGYALAWSMAYFMGAVVQGFRIIPTAIIVQVLVAILVPLGAGFFPVNSGARTSVLQAISNYHPGKKASKNNFFARSARWFKWISRPVLLSLRNTFRKKGRLLLTIFTLTMAGAVFIAVFNARDSLNGVIDQLLQHFLGDVTVSTLRPYRVSEVQQTLLEIPGVKRVEGWSGAAGKVWDEDDKLVTDISIIAPPQDTQLLNLNLVAGRWLLPGEEKAIVVSDTIHSFYPGLKPGDTLTIKLPGRQKEEWKVVGIFPFLALLGDPMAYANFEFIAGKNHLLNQATSFRVITKAHDTASQEVLARRIDRYLEDRNFAVQSVQAGSYLRDKAGGVLQALITFLLIMAFLTAFVGSIGLTGTMSINVLERTREIGVMRTIGAVDRVIMGSVIIEGLVIGLITWLLAIGLSFPITFLLLKIIGDSISGLTIHLSFTPLGILIWLVVVIVLSVIASIIPARNAARLTINEVLAYE